MASDVVETVIFKTKTWLKLRDWYFIKDSGTWHSRLKLETSKIVDFAKIYEKKSSKLSLLSRDVEAAISSTASASTNKKWQNDRWP